MSRTPLPPGPTHPPPNRMYGTSLVVRDGWYPVTPVVREGDYTEAGIKCYAGAVRWAYDGCDTTQRRRTASSPLRGGQKPPPLRYGGFKPPIPTFHTRRPPRRAVNIPPVAHDGPVLLTPTSPPLPPVPHNQGSKHTLLSTEVGIIKFPPPWTIRYGTSLLVCEGG